MKYAFIPAFIFQYFVSLPVAITLGFRYELEVKGFWIANLIGNYGTVISYFAIILRANWQDIADAA